jgi:hypothetical protein
VQPVLLLAMKLLENIQTLFDCVDLSFSFFCKHATAITAAVGVIIVYYTGRYVYRWVFRGKDKVNKIKYLISQSARHIDSAVSLRNSNPLLSLEKAIYGNVLAHTAKDMTDDKTALSKELSVDVYAYLDYTNTVLSQIKNSIKGKA